MKKLFLLTMSLFLVFSTNVVNAANNLKSLKINEVTYTEAELTSAIDMLSDEDWKWNPGSNTLTLDDFEGGTIELTCLKSQGNVNIFLKGSSEIYSEKQNADAYGIVMQGTNGSLTIRGEQGADLTISANATGTGKAIGINMLNGSVLQLSSASVFINTNAEENDSIGISSGAAPGVKIEDIASLEISAIGGGKNAYGIHASGIELTTTKMIQIVAKAKEKFQACLVNPKYNIETYEVEGAYNQEAFFAEYNTKIPVQLSGITFESKNYDGTPIVPSGELSFMIKKTKEVITLDDKEINYKYTGRTGNKTYNDKVPPTDAGTYKVTISIRENNETYSGKLTCEFEIYQVEPNVELKNLLQCEDDLKMLEYTVEPAITTGKSKIVFFADGKSSTKMPVEPGCYKVKVEVKDDKMLKDTEIEDVLNILSVEEYDAYLNGNMDLNNKWSNASKWALTELEIALKNRLIPSSLKEKDFTQSITREEFAAVAVKIYEKISGKKASMPEVNPFTDTENEDVLKAYALGITTGISATTFEPNAKITREQMATMMARALNKIGINTNVNVYEVAQFADHSLMNSWSINAIYYMSQNGIIKGVEGNRFDVTGQATREQALLISNRILNTFGN